MNLNSGNQRWSLWEYRVYPTRTQLMQPDFKSVKANCAKFGRLVFGSASSMHIRYASDQVGRMYWEIAVLTEGHPVHDPQYTTWMHDQWRAFLHSGFGKCDVQAHARLEAGDRQDGRPADQLIVLPGLTIEGDI
jgi:hypothetical protein